ncbi:NUDIX domain-containing protein [Enterococcus cecorum]|uniref:NUDIX hydrolase n=1 Tax=Enterococcus cecorum TaxID=44008 RepID=UPI00148C1689|nr:NUDIX domain-containing protein [Enterococcus cecorum]MCJ0543842.1 NUDIX domain-containing protein [Enterococcus cecorum]MCJ0548330.1 NUDIX domain-containing protein [Enterococcus cecorum]MCJ0605631.1 NUDIX domain-containing protein [Enterococcus cecorum]
MKYSHGAFNVVICNQKVLLVKRRDFPLWDLPGGVVESDELPSEAAIREMYEETGYEVQIDYEFARYIDKTRNDCQHLFISHIISGELKRTTTETRDLRWFSLNRLPLLIIPNRKRQIRDALTITGIEEYEISENWLIPLIRNLVKK